MNDQRDRRLARIEDLRSAGSDPYPSSFEVDADVTTVRGRFRDLAPDTVTDERVRMVGRVMLVRHHGGIGFITLQQGGDRIQVVLERDRIGPERLDRLRLIDRGDVVGIEGVVGTSRSGELSVFLESAQLLAASLRPSPDKHRGPTSSEIRLREREVDLYANDESRRTFEVRSSATLALRDELHARDFIEVETPVPCWARRGGAAARPFETYHNALDIDLNLRIALELYLKRLLVGGFERVFEIGRDLPQRGDHATTQSRVHDAGGVLGILRLFGHHASGSRRSSLPPRHCRQRRHRIQPTRAREPLFRPGRSPGPFHGPRCSKRWASPSPSRLSHRFSLRDLARVEIWHRSEAGLGTRARTRGQARLGYSSRITSGSQNLCHGSSQERFHH